MISKLAVTALMIAAVPMMGVATAEAAGGHGKGKGNASKVTHVKSAKKTAKGGKVVLKSKGTKLIVVHNGGPRYGNKRSNKRFNNRFDNRFGCVAAAKTRGGFGQRIPGIRGDSFGRNACQRALNECRQDLRHRKASGRNPFARCVIVRRG